MRVRCKLGQAAHAPASRGLLRHHLPARLRWPAPPEPGVPQPGMPALPNLPVRRSPSCLWSTTRCRVRAACGTRASPAAGPSAAGPASAWCSRSLRDRSARQLRQPPTHLAHTLHTHTRRHPLLLLLQVCRLHPEEAVVHNCHHTHGCAAWPPAQAPRPGAAPARHRAAEAERLHVCLGFWAWLHECGSTWAAIPPALWLPRLLVLSAFRDSVLRLFPHACLPQPSENPPPLQAS